jgi:arylsulfatase A-like enzyme
MSDDRPNVLVFFTDQQRWDTVGAYGSPMDLTPNLDEMADRGTLLERAFSSNPVCGPQRATLQSGQLGTENGVFRNRGALPQAEHNVAQQFGDAGYHTGYIGKWHLAETGRDPVPEGERAGYDHWVVSDVLEHTSHPYEGTLYDADGDPVEYDGEYRVDFLTDLAVDYVEERTDSADPFFLTVSHLEPHHQNDMDTYVAPEGYAEEYANPWVPDDLEGRPGDWHEELPDYYGICRRIDECFGRLLDCLDEQGIRENTVVLFLSDHGCHFRTRNEEYKRSCHESSIRVPAVLDGPGFEGGGRVEAPVSLLDVPPTLLDAAGLDVPTAHQGDSVRPLVDGDAEDWKDGVLVQVSETAVERAVRTERWKYSVYAPKKDGWDDPAAEEYVERYLYDLRADPHEEVNLVGRPDYREVADELRELLLDRLAAAGEGRPEIREAEYHA